MACRHTQASEPAGCRAGQENVTGESLPVLKQFGHAVFSGGQVLDGALVIRTSAAAADSTAARIARVTSEALQSRAPVETALNRLTKRWSEAVVAATAAVFAAFLLAGVPMWGNKGAVYRALGLLTAAAPCALLLVPLAFVCAVAVLSRHGIVVKGAHLFDRLKQVSFVALDKTGTVSEGQLTCTAVRDIWRSNQFSSVDPMQAAAALSFRGRHPVCSAVLKHQAELRSPARQQNRLQQRLTRTSAVNAVPDVTQFSTQAGAGMRGKIDGTAVVFGSKAHVWSCLDQEQRRVLEHAEQRAGSNTVLSVLVQGTSDAEQAGGIPRSASRVTLFEFSDQPRAESRGVISQLRKMGLRVGLYTGDNSSSAHAMAECIGVQPAEVQAHLTPDNKTQLVQELQKAGDRVLMVGDGINDAPALAQADVSIALAEDMESATAGIADVVLLHGSATVGSGQPASILRIAFLLRVARKVRAVVAQNLCIAFCSMVAGAGPVLGGLMPLWVAVLVHEGTTVLVALNSCRLLLLRQPQIQAQQLAAQQ